MRIAGATEPDIAFRVCGLGADLRKGFTRALQGERDPNAGLALELVRDGLAPAVSWQPGRSPDGRTRVSARPVRAGPC